MKKSNINNGQSLYTLLGMIVITVVSSVMFLLITLNYFDTKNKLVDRLKTDSNIILSRAQSSISYLIESYMVNEYDKLIINEMKKKDIFAMIVDNQNMAKMLNRDSFYNGKVRTGNWGIEDYDPAKHKQYISNNSFYEVETVLHDSHGSEIGKVKLYLSDRFIIKELDELIKKSIFTTTLISFGLILFLFITIRKYILKPLSQIISTIDECDQDGIPLHKISLSGAKEIKIVSDKINHMVEAVKDSKNELNEMNSFLQNLIDTAPVRIFWKDKDGRYLGANKLFIHDVGLSSEKEIVGKTDFDLFKSESEAQAYIDDDNEVIRSQKPKLGIVETQTNKSGEKYYLSTSKAPLLDKENNIFGILGIYEDITERIVSEEKIKAQEVQMVHQNRLAQMGEMISMIAHQWRQPLSVLGSLVSTLQLKTEMEKFEREIFREKLQKSAIQIQYLSETIDDFRNFFKPDKQKNKISSEKLIEDTIKIIGPALKQNDISLSISHHCHFELITFSNEMKQVLLNILKNSKDAFAENKIADPYIKIDVNLVDEKCSIIIEDNAGGIPQEIISRVFDPYFSTKSEKNGTGLGLYMSRLIVEDHCEGELKVQSSEGKTKFIITI